MKKKSKDSITFMDVLDNHFYSGIPIPSSFYKITNMKLCLKKRLLIAKYNEGR